MGMNFLILGCLILPLKTPDVIAQIQSQQQAAVRQLHQAPVDGGLVKAARRQLIGHFGMGERIPSLGQMLQHGDPATGAAQILGTQQIPRGFKR